MMSATKSFLSAGVGAVSGVAASLAAVSSSGAVSGLTVPGIATGLHSLGTLVGATGAAASGVAGLVVVATIPLLATGTAYGAYQYFATKTK
jgi:hypothetical protein